MKALMIKCSMLLGASQARFSILDPFKENAELDALEGMVDDIDAEWDEWLENMTEEERKNDPYGMAFIEELEEEYIEKAEDIEAKAIIEMGCSEFVEMLELKGMFDELVGDDIENYLAQLDGTGESTEVVDALKKKWMRCALSDTNSEESLETVEGATAGDAQ